MRGRACRSRRRSPLRHGSSLRAD